MSLPTPMLRSGRTSLAPFVDAGVLDAAAVHVADAIARAVGGLEDEVLLGAALTVRAPVTGHVCVVPGDVAEQLLLQHQCCWYWHPGGGALEHRRHPYSGIGPRRR